MTDHLDRPPIPRPLEARPGTRPVWAGTANPAVDLALVRARLSGADPFGEPDGIVPPEFADDLAAPGALSSAVLVPLFEEDGRLRVILTRRAAHLRTHSGQVSFPGGSRDPGETLERTALREAEEEIGLRPDLVEVVARMTPIASPARAGLVVPVVGLMAERPVGLVPNLDEVARVFDVGLIDLADDAVYREEVWTRDGVEWPVAFFEVDGETVWGLTARVLTRLLGALLH